MMECLHFVPLIACLLAMVLPPKACPADRTVEAKYLLENAVTGQISSNQTIFAAIQEVRSQTGIAFCMEYTTNDMDILSQTVDFSALSNRPLTHFIEALRKHPLKLVVTNNAVCVITPGAERLDRNAFDRVIEGFSYKGNHERFRYAVSKELKESSVSEFGASYPGLHPLLHYEIELKGPITIRDVLLHVASQHGVAYSAKLAPKSVVYKKGQFPGVMEDKLAYPIDFHFNLCRRVEKK